MTVGFPLESVGGRSESYFKPTKSSFLDLDQEFFWTLIETEIIGIIWRIGDKRM